MKEYFFSVLNQPLVTLCMIILVGYILGKISFLGVNLGSAGILLVALICGHFGLIVPDIIQELGLVCFVSAIGLIAGPTFFSNFIKNIKSYVFLGIIIVGIGALVCICIIKVAHIPKELAVGILAGALTSTPGLAAAIEAAGTQIAAIGYGIAYPFGVISVVLFVQLVPRFLNVNIKKIQEQAELIKQKTKKDGGKKRIIFEQLGLFSFACVIILGIFIAQIKIKLSGGTEISLGMSGGPLLVGLIIGHFGRVGRIDLKVPQSTLKIFKEAGMVMFLAGAGTQAGAGFVETLMEHGIILFLYGAFIAVIPMIIGFSIAYVLLRLDMASSLGAICGGMTSTPALGVLTETNGNNDVVIAYAATYPIALVSMVLVSQWLICLGY